MVSCAPNKIPPGPNDATIVTNKPGQFEAAMNDDGLPKISVLVVTYNHEKFIRQALDSVMMQKTDFEFEVIVADDYSQDRTPEIARAYVAANSIVRVLQTDEHLGITRNYQRGFAACSGQYVAILEGDDYWISPNKLETLAAYLDHNEECVCCFHRVFTHDAVTDLIYVPAPFEPRNQTRVFTAREVARQNPVSCFSTCMYRRNVIANLNPAFWKLKLREWPFNIVMAQHGLIGYLPEIMSVYRAQPGGIWSQKSPEEQFKQLLEIIDLYNEFLNFKYDAEFQAIKRKYRPQAELPLIQTGAQGFRRWVQPFVPPVLVSLLRIIYYRIRPAAKN
ncbi:MAG: glycosyltransferase family 2 protein [Pyrinomonadaceae bacterium]